MANVELRDRDRTVLAQVARYRLTTREVLLDRIFKSRDAMKGVLKRIAAPVRSGLAEDRQRQHASRYFLQARCLGLGKRVYYQLTTRGARELALPANRAEPFGPQALVEAYAVLIHCCRESNVRQLFTKDELAAHSLLSHLPAGNYYLEGRDATRSQLTRMVIDHRTDTARLLQKCRSILREGEGIPVLSQMIDQRAFGLAVLTLQPEKTLEIEAALAAQPLPVNVSAHVIPLLSELIQRTRHG